MTVVLDASVALSWCFPDEEDEYSDRILDLMMNEEGIVPPVWSLEIANAMVSGHRRGRIDDADMVRAVEVLSGLSITVVGLSVEESASAVASIAIAQNLSAYDASYLYIAMREGVPLATLDSGLRRAAKALGCAVLD